MTTSYFLPVLLWQTQATPWVSHSVLDQFLVPFMWVGFVGALAVGGSMLMYVDARAGRVTFYADRILAERASGSRWVHWGDVVGYRDGSSDFVQLVRRQESTTLGRFAVPTLNERDRTAVLTLLGERGVLRLE